MKWTNTRLIALSLALLNAANADASSHHITNNDVNFNNKLQFQSSPFVPLAFAAAKKGNKKAGGKKKKKNSTASSNRGFGIAPPTYEEVVSSFQTRMPQNDPNGCDCPCGSGGTYGECCGPFHKGDKTCQTMTDVLRTRYTAFSWRLIDYVIKTTHETCRDYREDKIAWAKDLNKQGMFDSFEFVKLDGGKEEEAMDNENEGYIEFNVTLRKKDADDSDVGVDGGSSESQETVISERSKFVRNPEDGVWSYSSGDVRTNVAGLEDTILNK